MSVAPAVAVADGMCESCRLHPAIRVVITQGEAFRVCQGCDLGARS